MPTERLLVTGANGHLGRRLLVHLARAGEATPRAVVRSERAAATLRELPEDARPEIHVIDYLDAAGLEKAAQGCAGIVHLVGILKEGSSSRYEVAHEGTSRVVADVAARVGARRIVYLSILGARADSDNACLASKARAEEILLGSSVPATVLRVPMVLGPGEIAAAALRGRAKAPFVFLTRGGASLEQPIDAEDVVRAIVAAASDASTAGRTLELAGPESLSARELLRRAASLLGTSPRVLPIPHFVVSAAAALFERVSSDPPLTRAMLGVLEHDDRIDPAAACAALGLALTPLDASLRRALEISP